MADAAIQTFPRALIAGPFGFLPVDFFESEAADRAVPVVDFAASSRQPR
jgi:hypothetical protein